MIEPSLIRELFDHMAWADAEVWRTVSATGGASADEALHTLLGHIHLTQDAFASVWEGREFVFKKPSEFESLDEIRAFALPFYERVPAMLDGLDAAMLAAPMPVPWAKFFARSLGRDPEVTTRGETLLQVALHTQYHRAQINARLRVLGAKPPLVDYIAWVWSGRPDASW